MKPSAGLLALAAVVCVVPSARGDPPAARVDYNRDVRPILAENCFQCHGRDEKARKADLRLDTRDGLRAAVVPNDPGKSALIERVTAHDPAEVMPPPKTGKTLTAKQVATLRAWVEQGAAWADHWAFTPVSRPPVPTHPDAARRAWARNPVDAYVLATLTDNALSPSLEADRVTLIRRVTLDLTGLPPTPEEVDAFLADAAPNAYEKVVDRVLTSPRYGERMAWRWLEAARYADTNGYQTDAGRDMWRWRDWVIEAYNRNLPFDRFTVEQLAGDLLPNPTLDQRIATGFNRNHRGNSEGGIVPEEYAAEYVADRVETTATVWLGLTTNCCRCHDHKYDPLSQKDYYRLFAFFNNVPEKGRAVKFGNSPPVLKAPTREHSRQLAVLDERVRDAERRLAGTQDEIATAQERWEKAADPATVLDWSPRRGMTNRWTVRDFDRHLEAGTAGDFGFDDRFTLACRVAPGELDGTILSRRGEDPQAEGYAVHLVRGKVQVHLTKRWLDDALRIETESTLEPEVSHHVAVTYDGTRLAAGTRVYVDGVEAKTRVLLDELNQSFRTDQPFRIGAGRGPDHRFNGVVDDVRIYGRVLEADEARVLAVAASPADILRTPAAKRTPAEAAKLAAYFREVAAPPPLRDAVADLRTLREERARYWDAVPAVMVMEELPTPRDTFVLIRGEYDRRGEKVTAGTPARLNPFPAGTPTNRLGLARWLVDPANPLAARVAVNRAWQLHFGTGLVKTTEDFGTQGAFPSHPELLDWLAAEFATDWDVKRLHRLIVTSATYRQASRVTPELLAKDPEDRLLARFPRLRLAPEMVRDQALLASGLLVERLGGPSVRPYQPAGLWKELSGAGDYVPDTGDGLYRRSLYTYWKRTAPPPVMAAFDAAGRETCWVRETRTNTPLQALALLNETGFVEAARVLAQRVMREAAEPDARLVRAFRIVTGRTPAEAELRVLRRGLDAHRADFRRDPAAARRLLAIGAAAADPALDAPELAALTTVCGLILNLDEAVTKG